MESAQQINQQRLAIEVVLKPEHNLVIVGKAREQALLSGQVLPASIKIQLVGFGEFSRPEFQPLRIRQARGRRSHDQHLAPRQVFSGKAGLHQSVRR